MKLPQTGGCQCGNVRYEITGKPLSVYTCHCLDCQRLTSSAFSLGVIVPEKGFRLMSDPGRSPDHVRSSDCPPMKTAPGPRRKLRRDDPLSQPSLLPVYF